FHFMIICTIFSSCALLLPIISTLTPDFYTLSLHDALPIFYPLIAAGIYLADPAAGGSFVKAALAAFALELPLYKLIKGRTRRSRDRKSTRLNSSHVKISYAVFCLKKK